MRFNVFAFFYKVLNKFEYFVNTHNITWHLNAKRGRELSGESYVKDFPYRMNELVINSVRSPALAVSPVVFNSIIFPMNLRKN